MQISQMCSSDIEQLSALEKECFTIPWSEASFRQELDNKLAYYLIARDADKVIGYCGVWFVAGEGQITNIAVHPEYRRKHVASGILEGIISHAKQTGISVLSLEVRVSNTSAQALYKKYGFTPVGSRKSYYADNNEDAIIMAVNLQ